MVERTCEKRRKLLHLFCVLALTLTLFPVSAYAEEQEVEVPSVHQTTETETEVTAESQVLQKGAYLSSGVLKLVDKENGSVGIYGSTTALQLCDRLYLEIYLERSKDGESWDYYNSWSYTAENESLLSKSFLKPVPGGYYYRLRGYHAAKEGSIKESTSSKTGGLYIEK